MDINENIEQVDGAVMRGIYLKKNDLAILKNIIFIFLIVVNRSRQSRTTR